MGQRLISAFLLFMKGFAKLIYIFGPNVDAW